MKYILNPDKNEEMKYVTGICCGDDLETAYDNFKEIFEKYKKRLMILGKEITVIQNQTEYRATAIDVDSVGHLIVKNEKGEIITLFSGEIRI